MRAGDAVQRRRRLSPPPPRNSRMPPFLCRGGRRRRQRRCDGVETPFFPYCRLRPTPSVVRPLLSFLSRISRWRRWQRRAFLPPPPPLLPSEGRRSAQSSAKGDSPYSARASESLLRWVDSMKAESAARGGGGWKERGLFGGGGGGGRSRRRQKGGREREGAFPSSLLLRRLLLSFSRFSPSSSFHPLATIARCDKGAAAGCLLPIRFVSLASPKK